MNNTMEETTTEGIRVQVESFYLDDHSIPEENRFVFAYHIRLKNLSQRTVQLMRRHWIITDSSGEKNEVKDFGTGLECVISIKDFIDFKVKDVIESYQADKIQRSI